MLPYSILSPPPQSLPLYFPPSLLQRVGSVYRLHPYLLDPSGTGRSEWSAVRLHPISDQLPCPAHCLSLLPGCVCQEGQRACESDVCVFVFVHIERGQNQKQVYCRVGFHSQGISVV